MCKPLLLAKTQHGMRGAVVVPAPGREEEHGHPKKF